MKPPACILYSPYLVHMQYTLGGEVSVHCKRFGLLQSYFGHLSYSPVVCVTHEVQGMLTT